MSRRRSNWGRRPLVALIILVLLLIGGYLGRARDHRATPAPQPSHSVHGA